MRSFIAEDGNEFLSRIVFGLIVILKRINDKIQEVFDEWINKK